MRKHTPGVKTMNELVCLNCRNVQEAEQNRDTENCNECESKELRAKEFTEF